MHTQPVVTQHSPSNFSSNSHTNLRTLNDNSMIVVIDDQMMNLEATKFLLTSFGIKGKIELFTNTNLALDFIMAYTIE